MKILILGAGKMGAFFCDLLSFDHQLAVCDKDPKRLRFTYNALRLTTPGEILDFNPDLVINAVTLGDTIDAFNHILPLIRKDAIIADIASVKTGLPDFYRAAGHPFVSSHPMFGPTFASLSNLANENAIVITEGDERGRRFFLELYHNLHLNVVECTFDEHDLSTSYSLSVPFASTLAFASVMEPQQAPGTTFKRHLAIARGLMSEDDRLLTEILFNPHTPERLEKIIAALDRLRKIVESRDEDTLLRYISDVRARIL